MNSGAPGFLRKGTNQGIRFGVRDLIEKFGDDHKLDKHTETAEGHTGATVMFVVLS